MAKSKEQYIAERTDDFDTDVYTFDLVDAHTVERLARDGDIKLPYKELDPEKDIRWNTKQFASRLLQGILNGDPIPNIANNLLDVVGYNEASAMRNARTMTTAAENIGRQDSYEELADKGVVQKKVWIATPDDRTRASHLELDGEEVDVDAEFSNGCMYPADPNCRDGSEIYNCRCSMRDMIIGFRAKDGHIEYIDHGRDKTMHFAQIAKEQEKRAEAAKAGIAKLKRIPADTDGPMRGVPKITGNNTIDDILKAVNPFYGKGRPYSENCANCAVATELRARGYDVEALPRDFSRSNNIPNWYKTGVYGKGGWADSFEKCDYDTIEAKRKTKVADEIAEKMKGYGDNSRAIIFIQWDGCKVGHYFNVINDGGEIKFIDTQKGIIGQEVKDYFLDSKPSMVRIWRTDDKEVTEFARKVVGWNG